MEKNRLVEPELIDGDAREVSLRPKWLEEYIGQEKVVKNLKILLKLPKTGQSPWITHF